VSDCTWAENERVPVEEETETVAGARGDGRAQGGGNWGGCGHDELPGR
jgi:hypothetical protein